MDLLTVTEACDFAGVTRKTIYNKRKAGSLKTIKTPEGLRFERGELEKTFPQSDRVITQNNTQELLAKIVKEVRELRVIVEKLTQEKECVITPEKSQPKTKPEVKPSSGRAGYSGSYEERGLQVISKAKAAYSELLNESGTEPQKKQVAERAKVSRGSVTKYWDQITSN